MRSIANQYIIFGINRLKQYRLSIIFIVLNVLVAAIGFIRSFYLGYVLNFTELGYITLIQTGATAVGFLHFGLLSGGFRLLAMKRGSDFDIINNTIITFFLLLLILLVSGMTVGYLLNLYSQLQFVSLAILIGFFSLLVNWITVVQFSKSRYIQNNIFNLVSSLSSLLFLLFWPNINVLMAAVVILIQPVLFLLLSVNYFKKFYFYFKYDSLSEIFKIGFITYLTTVLGLLYSQIERWTINAFLGVDALGQLYLLFIIVLMWNLIPISISNLFFPTASTAYDEKKIYVFKTVIKKNLFILCGYSVIIVFGILLLLEPFTKLMFKQHLPYIKYIYWALPGLVLKTISEGFYLLLSSSLNFKPIFRMDMFSFIFYCSCVVLLIYIHSITLINLIICFNLYCSFRFIYLFIEYKLKIRLLSKFHFE